MLALRIILAVLCFVPIAPLFGMGMRPWVANTWGLILLVLGLVQIFQPWLTKWTLVWIAVSLLLTLLFPENNSTSWH